MTITPSYSIGDNLFENNLDWLINSGIQGTVGQIKLGGYIGAVVAPIFTGVSGADSLNFALGQFAPTFDTPIRIPAHDHFSLGGFGDPVEGSALSVTANPPTPTRTITTAPTAGGTAGVTATPGEGHPTATASAPPPPTPTATPTPTPTPPDHGDANCDNRLSAADIDTLLPLLGGTDVSPCAMADVNEDGVVDEKDLNLLFELLFRER